MPSYFSKKRLLDPPVNRAAYSDRTAWIMATLSQLAYSKLDKPEGVKELKRSLKAGGFTLVKPISVVKKAENINTKAILVRKEGLFWALAFQGTTFNKSQIKTDLDARFLETEAGRAHRGFLRAFIAAEPIIKRLVRQIPKDEPFYITGHSLGGALATVATLRLEKHHTIAACYTFGSPRVGAEEWVEDIKAPVYRVANSSDAVPLLPFSGLLRNIPLVGKLIKQMGKFGFF